MFRILTSLLCISWCAYLADAGPVKDSIRGGGRFNFHGFRGKPKKFSKKGEKLLSVFFVKLENLGFETFFSLSC